MLKRKKQRLYIKSLFFLFLEFKRTKPTFRTPIIENLNISKHTFGQAT
jgi:hypothetical protein